MSSISRAPVRRAIPPSASGHATKRRLVEAAGKLFAEHGYAAVTVRDITRAAGANVSAVNYHFGGKLGLYEVVQSGHFERLETPPHPDQA